MGAQARSVVVDHGAGAIDVMEHATTTLDLAVKEVVCSLGSFAAEGGSGRSSRQVKHSIGQWGHESFGSYNRPLRA